MCYSIDVYIYQPLHTSWMRHKANFLAEFKGWNSEFTFSWIGSHNKAKDPSQYFYFTYSWKENSSQSVSALCEMQKASFRIWTCVSVSNS